MTDPAGLLIATVVIVLIGAVMLAVGVRLGMLVAPRFTRWADRNADEEPGEPDPRP